MHQFFVDREQIGTEYITITGEDVKHIKNVLRMKEGEEVRISDGAGGDFFCTIQKAVELGGYEIIPVEMKYCVVRLDDKKKEKKKERWQAIAKSAAKQAKRSRIPEIHPVMSYDKAVEYAKNCQLCLVPYENERGMKGTREVLKKIDPGMDISVMIGPEGGFSEEEIEMVREEMEVLSLGKRILRTDTAAITVMSMLMLEIEMKEEE